MVTGVRRHVLGVLDQGKEFTCGKGIRGGVATALTDEAGGGWRVVSGAHGM
jgi:hypothetical protein